ncbi:putative NAD-dependent epimerase [Halomicronema hongdechloris C2206]|uniref:NAD-dependent epimerase n=1 Tax=Halomicronema hongdechloris C2206 TaxID=1641165 RepID=A0A1Z3HHW9_9CYAN|nr:NAD-dependent epimerase/dehydratase family protein [Halomicronema hongdechloris]ASC69912.1 putative NAD-dependent epimerase [Halomicronema hongdechloris C2206]
MPQIAGAWRCELPNHAAAIAGITQSDHGPKLFLTSATGYIGSAVATALQARGYQVVGLARSEVSAQKLASRGVEPVRGDLTNPASWQQAVEASEGVIHTAAKQGDMAAVDGSVVEAIVATLAGTQTPFVYTSGIWVMGNTGAHPADEIAPLAPPEIVAWRPAVEERALAAVSRGVVRW